MKRTMSKKNTSTSKRKKRKRLSPDERAQRKAQSLHKKEIRDILKNIGFQRIQNVDGRNFIYDSRSTEIDDIFVYQNVILLMEYTIGAPHDHLLKKKIFYDKVNSDKKAFIEFIHNGNILPSFKVAIQSILTEYTLSEIELQIVYASKKIVDDSLKKLFPQNNISFFDYPIVKYFTIISKAIKKTTKYEFFDFLRINIHKIGENRLTEQNAIFCGQILPESKSSLDRGYKIITFYIDAESLLRRIYVLRNDSWRNSENSDLYQRLIIPKKIRSMRQYLNSDNHVFVNNIIATLTPKSIELLDSHEKRLTIEDNGDISLEEEKAQPTKIEIKDQPNIIGIIDGQHRIYAYHEGDDEYEKKIGKLRKNQNLLVTGILFPKSISDEQKRRFEAKLFLEINANQQGASPALKQTIAEIIAPTSSIAIAKYIINKLNLSGPLQNIFECHWYETQKIKTASIISYGLKPLIKLSGEDSIYTIWTNKNKENLLMNDIDDTLLTEYKDFCVTSIRDIFIALKNVVPNEQWSIYKKGTDNLLNVTTINGILNCLRLLIENKKPIDLEYYQLKFSKINNFNIFRNYKSSQYRQLGEHLYNEYFK